MNKNGGSRKAFVRMLVILSLAFGLYGRQCYADDDTQRFVQAYKEFLPKFIAALSKQHETYAVVQNIKYDVKKTDSAINPLIGVVSFISYADEDSISQGTYFKSSISFSFTDGKWGIIEAKLCSHTDSGGDSDWNDNTQDMNVNLIAAGKAAGAQTQPSDTRQSQSSGS
jgi:hypothetical protein